MSESLPAPQPPDPQTDAINETIRRTKMAEMIQTLLTWELGAVAALHELIVELVKGQSELGWNKFRTPNGRPCVIILGIGEGPVGKLTDIVYRLTHPQEEEDNGQEEGEPEDA